MASKKKVQPQPKTYIDAAVIDAIGKERYALETR